MGIPENSLHNIRTETNAPAWVENNPYLPLLEKRFFNKPHLVDWSHLPLRVSRLFLTVEQRYEPISEAEARTQSIYDLIHEGAFFPNSPVMMNTETSNNVNLFACHVLAPPISVSALKIAEEIHDGCGGIGYDLSLQDDPVSLTRYIESQTASLNSSRKRKAHSAVTLHVNHPQIESFIALGSDLSITHTNIDLDKDFFSRLISNEPTACNLWKVICSSITKIGKPAISFSEHKAKRSPNGEPLINNVCGESLLRENESALIGSLNLTRFIIEQQFDKEKFAQAARLVVRCLDNFHDLQQHASPIVAARCLESRKIGVGIMGYADALLMLGIRYGSTEALAIADSFMSILRDVTTSESEMLGSQRGSCASELLANDGNKIRRNASLMAIAANGTLSLIANVSGGIEPIFAYLIRQDVEGKAIYQLQPTLKKLLVDKGCDVDAVILAMQAGIPVSEISAIDIEIRKTLVTAHDISFIDHITTQATFQKYIDGGISKTINLNHSTTECEIGEAILYARNAGCVGISLYRDGSMNEQPTQMMEKR